jgi:type I restriction enzyme, S subunit
LSAYPEAPLGEICDVRIGRARTPQHQTGPDMVPYIRAANIKDGAVGLDDLLEMNFTPSEQELYSLQLGDVLVTEACGSPAELGASAQWRGGPADVVCFQNHVLRLRAFEGISDGRYLTHLARWCQRTGRWLAVASGTGILNIGQKRARGVRVPAPPLGIQRKIGAILTGYDDLIENNNRRIKIVEEMAQRLYREWFIDFRYPGHESVPLVDSELGRVPRGWGLGVLDDLLVLQRGFDLPKARRRDGAVPVIAATGRHGSHNQGRVNGPGVVTGRSGSLGTVLYIVEDFWPLNTTLWVKEYRRSTPEVAYFLLQSLGLSGYNSGAAVPTLNRNDIGKLPQLLPSKSLVDQFSEYARNIFVLVQTLQRSNDFLRTTQTSLLPGLISGEIDVADLDIALPEEAA